MRLPCSKGEQHLASRGRGVDAYILCIPETLFCRYLLFFFTLTVLLRCPRGTFWKLFPGDLKWCFLTELTVPMQKMEGIHLLCQRGKPDELRRLSLICIYCLTACTGQQGKQQRGSGWKDASTPGFWHPSAAGARGLFASLRSGAVSR